MDFRTCPDGQPIETVLSVYKNTKKIKKITSNDFLCGTKIMSRIWIGFVIMGALVISVGKISLLGAGFQGPLGLDSTRLYWRCVSTMISDVDDTFISVLAMIFGYSCYLCDLVRRNSRKSTSLSDDEKFLMDSLGRSSKVSVIRDRPIKFSKKNFFCLPMFRIVWSL